MVKEFKTVEELVSLLASRGIETDRDTERAIRQESYYAIINGYKDPFLDRAAMTSSNEDVYIKGTTFDQMYSLFLFDRDLRQALFRHLAPVEATMKTSVIYAFCSRYCEQDSYLDRKSYVSARDMLVPKSYKGDKARDRGKNLTRLMGIFNNRLTSDNPRPFVRHYLEAYGSVPLWVLANDLTFGNMSHFYQLQNRGIQNDTCKLVAKAIDLDGRISPLQMLRAFKVLVGYRNICAHDDRLYCAIEGGANLGSMLGLFGLVATEDNKAALVDEFAGIADRYWERLPRSISKAFLTQVGRRMPID